MDEGKLYIFLKNPKDLSEINLDKEVIFISENESLKQFFLIPSDIFVSYNHSTPLECRKERYSIPRDSLVIIAKDNDIKSLLEDEQKNYNNDYDIFSGNTIEIDSSETKIYKVIYDNIKLLNDVLNSMLEAGYLELENNKKIEDWIPSFEEPLLKIFNIYHGIETSNPSVDIEEEFIINPAFRKTILVALMKIISNFVINNDIVKLEEVSALGNWNDKSVWKMIKGKIADLN